MDGIINVRKERGFTSFDVVAILRGILHEKKIGHCGTLDPDAEGVLVVCAGHATRLVDLLTAHEKTYRASLKLGLNTDTQDTGGTILREREVRVSEEEVRKAVLSFIGEIDQIPPMYSAVKVNGKKLYELARAGKEADRKPRRVKISAIEIEKIDLPFIEMTVRCSKGTYIRTLCEDIGDRLGCGGAMASLIRVQSGAFSIENAWSLDEIRNEMAAPAPGFLIPLDACFYDLPSVTVKGEKDTLVRNGNPVRLSEKWFEEPKEKVLPSDTFRLDSREQNKPDTRKIRVYLENGTFAGVYEYIEDRNWWKPWKMFLSAEQGKKKKS